MIQFTVIDRNEESRVVDVPEGINLNLMEVLKASDYEILATCGGMALCATCHIEVVEGLENLKDAEDRELDMLDMMPDGLSNSRLACQLRVNEQLEGITIRIKGDLNG